MPLLAKEHIPIPVKDILTWCWENRGSYDQNKPIFVDAPTGESITANQAYALIRKIAAGLRAKGLKKGEVVCIHSFNNLFYPMIVLGTIAAGGVFVGTNPSYTPYELEHALQISKARFIITEPSLLEAPKKVAKQLAIPNDRILLFADRGDGSHDTWRSLLSYGEHQWETFSDLETAKNTTAMLLFSSGTTGLPKAAELSHYNLIAEHTLVHENPKHPDSYPMSMIGAMPFFHAAAAPYTHTSCLRAGFQSFIMQRFVLWDYLEYSRKYKITRHMFVPPMVIGIVNVARDHRMKVRECLASAYSVVGGAAPLDRDTQNKLQSYLPPQGVFTQLWAMSETSCVASYFYYPESDSTGSVGRFMPNLDVKIVDDEGREIGPYGVRGEICVRGPTVIRGYLDNSEANARDWDSDGFFHTGDIAICDEKSGLWYIVDRKKELIKVRGFQVAPAELEGVLLAHHKIQDAAVIGVEVGEAGELPRAYVVKRENGMLSEGDVKSWVEGKLAKYKRLEGGVKFVDVIPKTASGKILKRVLRDMAKRETQAKL